MPYNYRTYTYADGTVESRFYSHPVVDGKKIVEHPREYVVEPFTGTLAECVLDFDEIDKRKERAKMVSRNRTIQNIYAYARANIWDWFVTLTFNPGKVNRFDYKECQKKLTLWINNLKRDYPDLYYIMVPEMHMGDNAEQDEHGNYAWHFHGMLGGVDISSLMDFSGHFTKKHEPIYNIGRYRFGWSTATEVCNQEACCKYITKYITKDLCNATSGRKRYWVSRNCKTPDITEAMLDRADFYVKQFELQEDCTSFKRVTFDMGMAVHAITYYENKGDDINDNQTGL